MEKIKRTYVNGTKKNFKVCGHTFKVEGNSEKEFRDEFLHSNQKVFTHEQVAIAL